MEMQQRLHGEWDVKVMGISAGISDKQPYQAVVRGQIFLLQCVEDGKVIGTSPWKMIWPEADHPDVVNIVWDPNNTSDEDFCPGRIAHDGKSFQLALRTALVSGMCERPIEICSGDGISYIECVRKQPTESSPPSLDSKADAKTSSTAGPMYSGHPLSWWLDSYWDNATANPKTADNGAAEYVASEAIRKLRNVPETYHSPEEVEARQLAELLDESSEPMMLVPAPSGLSDPQFQFPSGAVDAIVVHPPSIRGPSQRVHSFPTSRLRVAGSWNGSEWPVQIGAFKKGESQDSIALDQVMLRDGEKDFVLWVPSDECEVRIYGLNGQLLARNVYRSVVYLLSVSEKSLENHIAREANPRIARNSQRNV